MHSLRLNFLTENGVQLRLPGVVTVTHSHLSAQSTPIVVSKLDASIGNIPKPEQIIRDRGGRTDGVDDMQTSRTKPSAWRFEAPRAPLVFSRGD